MIRKQQMSRASVALLAGAALFSVACADKTAVVQAPPDNTPVAQAAPAPPPQQLKQQPAAPKQVAAAPKQDPAPPAAAPKKLTPEQRESLNQLLARLEDALFDYDKSTIRPDALTALRDNVGVIRGIMAGYPTEKILIEGHADERGSSEYNLALGDRRARAVHEFLTQQGIPDNQLTIISYGEERPACTTENENCWQRNRRAHLTVAP